MREGVYAIRRRGSMLYEGDKPPRMARVLSDGILRPKMSVITRVLGKLLHRNYSEIKVIRRTSPDVLHNTRDIVGITLKTLGER